MIIGWWKILGIGEDDGGDCVIDTWETLDPQKEELGRELDAIESVVTCQEEVSPQNEELDREFDVIEGVVTCREEVNISVCVEGHRVIFAAYYLPLE